MVHYALPSLADAEQMEVKDGLLARLADDGLIKRPFYLHLYQGGKLDGTPAVSDLEAAVTLHYNTWLDGKTYDPVFHGSGHLMKSAGLAEEFGAEGLTVHSHFNAYTGLEPPSEDETIDAMFDILLELRDEHPRLNIHLENFGAGWRPDGTHVTSPLDFMQPRIIQKIKDKASEIELDGFGLCLDLCHINEFLNMLDLKKKMKDYKKIVKTVGHNFRKFSNISDEDLSLPTPSFNDFIIEAGAELTYVHVGDSYRWDGKFTNYEDFESLYMKREGLQLSLGDIPFKDIVPTLDNEVIASIEIDVKDHKNPIEMEWGILYLKSLGEANGF